MHDYGDGGGGFKMGREQGMGTMVKTFVHQWLNAVAAFFYPENCQLCEIARATAKEGFVCPQCWQQVRFIRPPFCNSCGLPFDGDITTAFECANCRDMELHFRSARSAVVAKT